MKASDADILMIPGYTGSGPEHWQTRWKAKLSTARFVEQDDWDNPDRNAWRDRIAQQVNAATKPVVLVAHSLGIPALMNAIPRLEKEIKGAFLVAPPDLDSPNLAPASLKTFGPYPRDPLPFPSITVGSNNDPFCELAVAEDLAAAWGSLFINAGEAGHINTESGYGPWPEGTMTFAHFVARL